MFNFFDELKTKTTHIKELIHDFNIVNVSGRVLYVEGHAGLTILDKNMIAFKINKGRVVVEGEDLVLSELTSNTMLIEGKILKTEIF